MISSHEIKSLYLHFPHCRHLCNYCDFFKSVPPDFDEARDVFQFRLENQWEQQEHWFESLGYRFAPLDTLYLGGGTPSLWGVNGAKWFEFLIPSKIQVNEKTEWTMEVNPGAWENEGLKAWQDLGVNRFSMGVQSYNEKFLKVLDRFHDLSDVDSLLNRFRDHHFSVDLMLGLPFSQSWNRDLRGEILRLIDSGAEHFSVYILTVKDNYKHYKDLPSEEYIEEEYLLTSELLRAHGFDHYEVSNFAKPGARARHNLKYWQAESVAALGPSAVGYLANTGHRYKWKPNQDFFEIEELDQAAIDLERAYLQLRLDTGLNDFDKTLMSQDISTLESLMQDWKKAGWLKPESSIYKIMLTPNGFLMMDSVTGDLLKSGLIK